MSNKKANNELLDVLKSKLTISRKFSEKQQKNIKKWLKDYNAESIDELREKSDDIYNLLQIPYIFSTVESQLPSIFENLPELLMTRKGKKDKEFTDFTNMVWNHLKDIIHLKEKVEFAGFDFLTLGMSTAEWGWKLITEDVEVEEEQPLIDEGSQIGSTIVKKKITIPVINKPYLKIHQHNRIFFSPESYFTCFDTENQIPYIIVEDLVSQEYMEEKYGDKSNEDNYLKIDGLDEEEYANDEKMKEELRRPRLYTYYGVLPKAQSGEDNWRSDKIYKTVFCNTGVKEKPESISSKPISLLGNYGTYSHFHRFGEPKVMRELEQDISLGRSTIADYRDKMATKIAIDTATEVDEHSLRSPKKLALVRYSGANPPAYMRPPSIPDAIIESLNMSKADAQMVSAQLDISRGGTESIVDTATGQKIFAGATEKRINRKRAKIGEFIRAIAINLLKLCADRWEIDEFEKITDIPANEIAEKGFLDKLASLDDMYNVSINVEDVVNNKTALSAQAIALYRETREDPLVNRREILRNALEIGFGEIDYEKFLQDTVTPEDVERVIGELLERGIIPPEAAQMIIAMFNPEMQQQMGDVGRPGEETPDQIMQDSMEGSDSNQMEAQAEAAPQQMIARPTQGI